MKKSSSAKPGNTGRQINHTKSKAPEMHDSTLRRQPPTPQDIKRVQPVSQNSQKNQIGRNTDAKIPRDPK